MFNYFEMKQVAVTIRNRWGRRNIIILLYQTSIRTAAKVKYSETNLTLVPHYKAQPYNYLE